MVVHFTCAIISWGAAVRVMAAVKSNRAGGGRAMKISIIVCTRNRAHAIHECLQSIAVAASALSADQVELVIVDNASEDDTGNVIKEWAVASKHAIRLVCEAKRGLSAARNAGIKASTGDVLVFTDDDCRMGEDYLTTLRSYTRSDLDTVLRGGCVKLGDQTDLPLTIQENPAPQCWRRSTGEGKHAHLGGGIILGCNLVMGRQLADRIGPFDELVGAGAPVPAGEDTDYVLRAYLADIPIEYDPKLVNFHFHGRKTAADGRRIARNYVIGAGALYAKYLLAHPNIRRRLVQKLARRSMVQEPPGLPSNNLHPSISYFSKREKLYFALQGALRYSHARLRSRIFKPAPAQPETVV